jgi:hypothetical protein
MWGFNERHDFGVETDPTEGEFFVNNDIDRSSVLIRTINAIRKNASQAVIDSGRYCDKYSKSNIGWPFKHLQGGQVGVRRRRSKGHCWRCAVGGNTGCSRDHTEMGSEQGLRCVG